MIAIVVYALGAFTCLACSVLLLRGFARSHARLLLWAGLCFACLTANNLLLVINEFVATDLRLVVNGTSLVGVSLLLYGLIWDMRE